MPKNVGLLVFSILKTGYCSKGEKKSPVFLSWSSSVSSAWNQTWWRTTKNRCDKNNEAPVCRLNFGGGKSIGVHWRPVVELWYLQTLWTKIKPVIMPGDSAAMARTIVTFGCKLTAKKHVCFADDDQPARWMGSPNSEFPGEWASAVHLWSSCPQRTSVKISKNGKWKATAESEKEIIPGLQRWKCCAQAGREETKTLRWGRPPVSAADCLAMLD